MTGRAVRTVWCVSAMVAAAMLTGCGSDDNDSAGAGGSGATNAPQILLTGEWDLSQATVSGFTVPTARYGTAQLTLNVDETFSVLASPTGGVAQTYTGTYTTNGNTISFNAVGVPASAGVTMPVTATYTFDVDSLELQLTAPITVSGFTVTALFLVR